MAETTIPWTWRQVDTPFPHAVPGYTFNAWWGCFKVSPGCKHCYAEGLAKRYGFPFWGPPETTPRRLFIGHNHWTLPLKWNRLAKADGHRRSVFCASMSDVFEIHPDVEPERQKLWPLIEETQWLNWLLLTKRPENILSLCPWGSGEWPDNVWIGTSVEDQHWADIRIPLLLQVRAVVRFVSYEPALGPVDFTHYLTCCPSCGYPRPNRYADSCGYCEGYPQVRGLQWIICGGESGHEARPFDLDWARSTRDQCVKARVPFHFKQVGGLYHNSGGRLLNGRTWDELPPERGEPIDPLT